jgi:hypothetical protein
MARNGPVAAVRECPSIGVERKWLVDRQTDAIDPQQTSEIEQAQFSIAAIGDI